MLFGSISHWKRQLAEGAVTPAENLFLLAFLVASIYGIYRLIVYVLAQG